MPGSHTSESSAGSASTGAPPSISASMKEAESGLREGGDHDLLETDMGVQAAVFGVVYTLSKEKLEHSWKFAASKIAIDFLQLFLLIVNPAFGWHIDEHFWLWRYLLYLQFKNPIISKGYSFYIVILYTTVVLLAVGALLCLYVGWCFKNDRFPYVWPIKALRFVVSVFFVVFYVGSLSVFLVALQCNWFNPDKKLRFHLQHFDQECLAMPHLLHAFAAAISALIFIIITVAMTVADFELNPTSQGWLSQSSSVVELRSLICRTAIMFSSSFLDGHRALQVAVIAVAMWLMFYSYVRWMPYYNKWVNHTRAGLYCGLTWASLILLFLVIPKSHNQLKHRNKMTDAMLGGLAPFILLGFGISYLRFEVFFRRGITAFKNHDPQKKLKDIYRFSEEVEVEVLSRVCRKWVDEDTLDKEALDIADLVIKAGMARLGSSNPTLVILYSNFLMEVQGLYQNGLSQLQAAKKLRPNIIQKFVIFTREQLHRQRAQAQNTGESAVDLVSYVEFQKNFRSVCRQHKSAMYATRYFWKELLSHHISFAALTKAFEQIQKSQNRAERTYNMVLERYPDNAKLLRNYGRFLDDVKHDPWRASKYYSEADKIEEEGDQGTGMGGFPCEEFSDADAAVVSQLNDKNAAVIMISAQGTILMANKLALKMFGYKKPELESKNISILMPQPFSQRHDSFLKNYVQTGKAHILNQIRDVVGLHKDRHVFPLAVAVSKASGMGNDAVFVGLCLPAETTANVVRCWVMTNGIILCVNEQFTDWFGKAHKDILGKTFDTLAVEQGALQEMIEAAGKATEEDFKAGRVAIKGVRMLHKYLDSVQCNIRCNLGGTEAQRLLVMDIQRVTADAAASSMMVTDTKGQIMFATSGLASMLGYQVSEMVGRLGIQNLMNPPFSQLHQKWLQELPPKIPLTSCRNNSTVVAVTSNGASIPVRLTIQQREDAGESVFLVKMVRSTFDEGLELRRLAVIISKDGHVDQVQGHPPMAMFGFKPKLLEGSSLKQFVRAFHDLVDIKQVPMKSVIASLVAKSAISPGYSWRVGVHAPITEEMAEEMHNSATAHAIWKTQIKQSVLEVTAKGGDEHGDDEHNPEAVSKTLHVYLHRADAITGIIELDRSGSITKAGCCPLHMPGLIFGVPSPAMLRQPLNKFIDLGGQTFQEVLLQHGGEGKKAIKTKTVGPIKLGPIKKLNAFHADGDPQTVTVQAVQKDASARRTVVRITITHKPKGMYHGLQRTVYQSLGKAFEEEKPGVMSARASAASITMDAAQVDAGVRSMPALMEDEPAFMAGGGPDDVPIMGTNLDAIGLLPGGDDNASQVSGSHGDASSAAGDDDQGTDYRRGKRYKKLQKMLCGKRTQLAISRFHTQTYLLLGAQLAVHLLCFSLFAKFITELNAYVSDVDAAGRAADMLHRMAMNSLILRELHRGHEAPGIYMTADIPKYTKLFRTRIDEFETMHRGIYLGAKSMRQLQNLKHTKLRDIWEKPTLTALTLADHHQPSFKNVSLSLWELGSYYIMAGREVMSNHDRMAGSSTYFGDNTTDLESNRFWQFVVNNGPGSLFEGYKAAMDALVTRAMDQVGQVNTINVILLVLEGCLVGFLVIFGMFILMKRIMNLRYRLYSSFLIVPAGFLRALSSKRIQVDVDDVDYSDSEDGDAVEMEPTLPTKVPDPTQGVYMQFEVQKTLRHTGSGGGWIHRAWNALHDLLGHHDTISVSRRTLKRDAKNLYTVLVPLILWSSLVLAIYSVSYTTLKQSSSGLIANAISNSFSFRIVRVIFWALNFCSRENAMLKNHVRSKLDVTVERLDTVYSTLMYGNVAGDYTDTRYSTPGTAFNPIAPVHMFFKSRGRCWRANQTSCFTKGNEYYQIANNGLDAMTLRLVEEARLLNRDTPDWVNMSSSRCNYIWKVANYDLYEGSQTAGQQYTKLVLASFNKALEMHVVLFVVSWIAALLFMVCIINPFLRRLQSDSQRVAELLSQLPADMDVESLVAQAMGYGGAAGNDDTADDAPIPATRPARRSADRMSLDSAAVDGAPVHNGTGHRPRRTSFSIPGNDG